MRELAESRDEFNLTMRDYTAMIIHTEHKPFSDAFFSNIGLNVPQARIYYIPPPFVGAEFSSEFIAAYGSVQKPRKSREEKIPVIDKSRKYLVCDDYSNEGETFEIAMIRLIQQGIMINDIWCISAEGNSESKKVILDRGTEWHKYHKRQYCTARRTLEELGFSFPSLD